MVISPSPTGASARRRLILLACSLALAGVQAALLVRTARDKSDTVDETTYIASAVLMWAHGDLAYNAESPALPKWAFAAALRAVDRSIDWAPPDRTGALDHMLWYGSVARLRRNLFAVRLTTIVFVVVAGFFLRAAARRFGDTAGLVSHALWCLSPTLLAHGSLASLDAWAAALMCVLLWSMARFVERPRVLGAALAGVVLAAAAASKLTTLGVTPVLVAAGAWALRRRPREQGASWRADLARHGAAAGLAFFVTLWAVYGFRVGWVTTADDTALPAFLRGISLGPAPFPAWISGLLEQWSHGARGHRTYLFGEVSRTGWWWFYLAALALKTTLGAQLLTGLLVVAWLRRPPRGEAALVDAALLAYPLLLLLVLSLGNTQLGVRYMLPAFPFAMLWAGRGFERLGAAFGRRLGPALGCLAILGGGVESVRVHPHHLMFFNAWAGGPEGGPRYLVVSDDWGQDQRRLAQWMRDHAVEWVYYTALGGNGNPGAWGIVMATPPCTPRRGVYALHAAEVHRPRQFEAGCFDWLTLEPPDERIGHSIYIYRVTKGRLERLKAAVDRSKPFWRSGVS